MRSNRLFIMLLLLAVISGCGGGGGSGGSTPRKLVSITINPASPSIAAGTVQQFSATGTFSDSTTQDLTAAATWTSSNSQVAAINVTGRATTITTGTTTISASWGGISGTTPLIVTSATLVSLAIQPTNPSIAVGTTQQFSVNGTFSDNTIQDLTTLATWSSSNTSVATVSNTSGSTGRASTVAAGTTTITATVPATLPITGNISGSTILTVAGSGSSQANVLPITVNGSLCSSGSYPNKPCVSVTVCTPGTSTCQVITDILLDTGSYGLRIFKQALNVSLPQVTAASGSLTECVQFGDGSSDWGPVQMAGVILGNEPAIQVPIQVIDSTFGTRSRTCQNADVSPAAAGFNGILGVGLLPQDCGALCVSSANNGIYSACTGTSCSGTIVPLSSQVQNPVALLPQDNNGVLVQLPSVPLGGLTSLNGSLVLGIGTQPNNTLASVTVYPTNSVGEFTTTFNGVTNNSSFIDSGSNGLFFTSNLLPSCPAPNTGFYCPSATTSFAATNTGAFGSPIGTVPFQIGNLNSLIITGNNVFADIGGNGIGGFDWGLPFFFGRNVFIGIKGANSILGSGPFWAY
ncbi:MAG: DUF3443 family protein [Desulfuromonadales bacterium]|nr:DUF3443 family protein [Desulfuromonadales bacterium]